MINSLPLFHRMKGQKVLVLGEGAAAEPKKRLVERAGGIVESDIESAIQEGVRIAFIAFDDPEACKTAAVELRRAGILVNVVDMPELCDFTTPSILDRDPVLIAVGTGGASAGLAKHIRLRLEPILPQSLGKLADALFGAREELRRKFPSGADRRRAIDEALREGGPLDPFDSGSADEVDNWIKGPQDISGATLETIFLASDDPADLTLRQARLLGVADVIVLVGQIPETILARARADAQRIPVDQADEEYAELNVVCIVAPGHAA